GVRVAQLGQGPAQLRERLGVGWAALPVEQLDGHSGTDRASSRARAAQNTETARASPSAARRVAIRARAARSPSWPSSTAAAVRARRSSASAGGAWMQDKTRQTH